MITDHKSEGIVPPIQAGTPCNSKLRPVGQPLSCKSEAMSIPCTRKSRMESFFNTQHTLHKCTVYPIANTHSPTVSGLASPHDLHYKKATFQLSCIDDNCERDAHQYPIGIKSPQSSAKLSTRKRAYSTSPLSSDLTEYSSLIHGSPNYLPLPPMGHLIGQNLRSNFATDLNFNNSTFETNKIIHKSATNTAVCSEPLTQENTSHLKLNKDKNESNAEDPSVCQWDACTQQFSSIHELVHHIENIHIEKGVTEDYTCLWRNCPRNRKPFNARYKLMIHMRIHSGEKPNKCTYAGCLKAFSRLENLKIHMRTHTGEKPYICQYSGCSKSFSNSSDRSKHQRTHYEEKPYACNWPDCEKRYTDPSSLRKHSRSHNQQKKPPHHISDTLSNCLQIRSISYATNKPFQQRTSQQQKVTQIGKSVIQLTPHVLPECNYCSSSSSVNFIQHSQADLHQLPSCSNFPYLHVPPHYYNQEPYLSNPNLMQAVIKSTVPVPVDGSDQLLYRAEPSIQYIPNYPPPPYDDCFHHYSAHTSNLLSESNHIQNSSQTLIYYN